MPGQVRSRSTVRLTLAAALAVLLLAGRMAVPATDVDALSRWTGGIDLYRSGVFTTQKTWLWCTAADVQIIRNIVDHATDHSRSSQQRYFDYMRAHDRYAIPLSDGVDPAGWAAGLRRFVDSRYQLTRSGSFESALRSAVTNLRRTNLPVAITVSHGNHALGPDRLHRHGRSGRHHSVQRHERARRRAAVGSPEPELRLRHAARHEAHAGPAEGVLHPVALRRDPDGMGRSVGVRPAGGEGGPRCACDTETHRQTHPEADATTDGRRPAQRRPRSRARPLSRRRPRALRQSTRWPGRRDRSRARSQSPRRRRRALPLRPARVSRRPSWPVSPWSWSRSRSWRQAVPVGFAHAGSRRRRC